MPKITVKFITNLKTKEATKKVHDASKKALLDTLVAIVNYVKKDSPFLSGHNRRSIAFEMGPGGEFDKKELQAATFSTSGYGGYLETGTSKMPARPYFKPALDKNMKNLPKDIKAHLRSGL